MPDEQRKISKVIFYENEEDTTGTVWMDVTQKTVTESNMLSGVTALKNDGTDIVGTLVPTAQATLQNKTHIAPTTSSQTIVADTGYDGLSSVQIDAMPSGSVTAPSTIGGTSATITTGTNTLTLSKTVSVMPNVTTAGYISSGTVGNTSVSLTASVNTRSSDDLTTNGATVTAPAGYYENAATKTIASGTEGVPTATKGTVTNHSISVTPNVTNTAGYIEGSTKTGTAVTVNVAELESGNKEITANGTNISVSGYSTVSVAVPTSSGSNNYQIKSNINPTENSQTIEPDNGYDALSSVQINAISSDYVGSAVDRRDDTDLTSNGATVTIPAGYYSTAASKSVATGSVTAPDTISGTSATVSTGTNTLTLSKTVSVTPSVTSAGYISSGTAGNAAVSLTASINTRSSSDLTANGATVTAPAGYYASAASKAVASGTAGTPTATKGTVSNHSVTVTPSVTNTTGYITGGTLSGTAVTVTAAELESGTKTITENGMGISVSGYSAVDVEVPSETGYKVTIGTTGNATHTYVLYNNITYYTAGDTFNFTPGDTLTLFGNGATKTYTINGGTVLYDSSVSVNTKTYLYTLPEDNVIINLQYLSSPGTIKIGVITDHKDSFRSIIERTISGVITNSEISYVGSYAFGSCSYITSCSFPNASWIGDYAFIDCNKLTSVYAPLCQRIGHSAFYSVKKIPTVSYSLCSIVYSFAFMYGSISQISLPACTSIGAQAFFNASMTGQDISIYLPVCQTIGSSAFAACGIVSPFLLPSCTTLGSSAFRNSKLSQISLPECTQIGGSAFYLCSYLSYINLPKVTSLGSYAFGMCPSLTKATFSVLSSVLASTFSGCSVLSNLYFYNANFISQYAFLNCTTLTGLYLLGSTMATLSNKNAFNNTPISVSTYTGDFGSIYVKASLFDAYKAATNWVTYSDRFVSLTDAQIEALNS